MATTTAAAATMITTIINSRAARRCEERRGEAADQDVFSGRARQASRNQRGNPCGGGRQPPLSLAKATKDGEKSLVDPDEHAVLSDAGNRTENDRERAVGAQPREESRTKGAPFYHVKELLRALKMTLTEKKASPALHCMALPFPRYFRIHTRSILGLIIV